MPLPSEFFTPASLGTLAGATGIIGAIAATVRKLTGWQSKWLVFGASVVVGITAASLAGRLDTLTDWLVALANTCLLFCTAIGGNEALVEASTPKETGITKLQSTRRASPWLQSWFVQVPTRTGPVAPTD